MIRCDHCHADVSAGGKHAARCPLRPPDVEELRAQIDAIAQALAFLLRHIDTERPLWAGYRHQALAIVAKLEGKCSPRG